MENTTRRHEKPIEQAEVNGALVLAGLGLVGLYFPAGGFAFGIAGTIIAIRALRRNRDRGLSVFALSWATTDIALSVSGFIWSRTSPAPP